MKLTDFCLYNTFFCEIKSSVKRKRGKLRSGSSPSSSAIFVQCDSLLSSIIPQGPPPNTMAPEKSVSLQTHTRAASCQWDWLYRDAKYETSL